jgi:hypothetical protein
MGKVAINVTDPFPIEILWEDILWEDLEISPKV